MRGWRVDNYRVIILQGIRSLVCTQFKLFIIISLNWVQTSDLNLLTSGSDDLTYEENINIFKHVFNLIKSSKVGLVTRGYKINMAKTQNFSFQYDDMIDGYLFPFQKYL